MNVNKIKEIVNSNLPQDIQAMQIIDVMSSDENVVPTMLKILQSERKTKTELVQDMNLELSRAHIYIEMRKENKKEQKEGFDKTFVIGEIAKFYSKYKGKVLHCFNRFN